MKSSCLDGSVQSHQRFVFFAEEVNEKSKRLKQSTASTASTVSPDCSCACRVPMNLASGTSVSFCERAQQAHEVVENASVNAVL
jgi:hypothetical protein